MPLLENVGPRDRQDDRVTDHEVRYAGNHGVQCENPQNRVRGDLARLTTSRTLATKEPSDELGHGVATLSEMHEHEDEDEHADDGVIGGPRVAQVLAREEHRRDNGGEETNDQREVDQPSIPSNRVAV